MSNRYDFFIGKYKIFDKEVRSLEALSYFLQLLPRYLMESIGIFLIAIYSYIIVIQQENIISSIPEFNSSSYFLFPKEMFKNSLIIESN